MYVFVRALNFRHRKHVIIRVSKRILSFIAVLLQFKGTFFSFFCYLDYAARIHKIFLPLATHVFPLKREAKFYTHTKQMNRLKVGINCCCI